MNDVVSGDEKSDLGVGRNHQRLIYLEQIVLALVRGVVNLFLSCCEVREERHGFARLIEVLVLPLPLIAGNQNIQLCFVVVVNLDERRRRGNSHRNQNEKRHDRPGHFDLCALVEL